MQWLSSQIERRHHKHAFTIIIWHDNDFQHPANSSPAYDDSRIATTWQILKRPPQHILDFGLVDIMSVNV